MLHNIFLVSWLVFLLIFLLIPFSQSNYLSMMPGDIGDARLNNYFLENIYQFFAGSSDSLWHFGFFSPFPYVIGFSDNLFGSAPVYLGARLLTGQPDTAFQLWYLFSYFVNFSAAYYAFGKLKVSPLAALVGSLIFTFALPATIRSGHAQLCYRFAVPLAAAMFILFLDKKRWIFFVMAVGWLIWQFYCSIYIGFFTLLLMGGIFVVYILLSFWKQHRKTPLSIVGEFISSWHAQAFGVRLRIILSLLLLIGLLILLFYPYLCVTQLYSATRSLDEIASMLPRPYSYFLSDRSWLWSSLARKIVDIPMRHEHQMFIGAVPMLLAFMGCIAGGYRARNNIALPLLAGTLAGLILLTLNIGGFSLWLFLAKLPLASAIRAMTRIDLVLLFPVAYLAAIAVDQLRNRSIWLSILLFVIVIPAMIFEFSATSVSLSKKSVWRERVNVKEESFPNKLPIDPILFFAQSNGPFFADEIDAMWISLKHGVKTLNGYSGFLPSGLRYDFGNDCMEVPRRVSAYLLLFGHDTDQAAYVNLMRRIVPIGFKDCDEKWIQQHPPLTLKNRRPYSIEEFHNLSLHYLGKAVKNDKWTVEVKVVNASGLHFALYSVDSPIRLSWRFIDTAGKPVSGWDTRMDLPFDVGADSFLNCKLLIDPKMEIKGGSLQVSLVQEGLFWGHDIGIEPLMIPWD